jgi:protein SPT2
VTLESEQGDEDDYGYTSTTSDQFHKKLMEKYQKLPEDKKFSSSSGKHKALSKDEIQKAKDRMKDALSTTDDHQHFKQSSQHRTSRLKGEKESFGAGPSKQSQPEKPNGLKPKPIFKPAPIVDFQQLLKLAEQKQHEDIIIAVPTKKEPERLLTSKEKKELEEMEAARKAKMKPNRIPKLGAIPKVGESSKQDKNNNESLTRKPTQPAATGARAPATTKLSLNSSGSRPEPKKPVPTSSNSKLRDALQKQQNGASQKSSSSSSSFKVPNTPKNGAVSSGSTTKVPSKSISNGCKPSTSSAAAPSKVRPNEKPRDFPPKDLMRSREFPPKDLMRSREFPPKDLMRSREFPPRDLKQRPKQSQQQISRKREF